MGISVTEAKSVERQHITNQETRNVSLFLHIYFDGHINPSIQYDLRTKFRSSALSQSPINENFESGKWIYIHEHNNNAKETPSNYEIREDELSISISTYEDKHAIENSIKRILYAGKQKIMAYLLYNDIEDLMVHIYLYGINVGDAISHLFSTFGDTQQEYRPQQIENLLFNNRIRDERISYCNVDYIGFFDQAIEVSTSDFTCEKPVLNNSIDLSKSTSVPPNLDNRNRPIITDIFDAMELAQYTYEMQSPIAQSLPSAINHIFKKEGHSTKDLHEYQKKTEKNGWAIASNKLLADLNLTNRLVDFTNGFYSQLFVKEDPDRGRIYAYCTCGTNMTSIKDWFDTNILQGLIGLSAQYTKSVQNAQKLDSAIGSKAILFFIGHSLGGGLASNNAIVTKNRYAITFNAAGLCPLRLAATGNKTLKKQLVALWNMKTNINKNRLEAQKRVLAFIIKGEILNATLSNINEGALGHIIEIDLDAKQISPIGKHGLINFMQYAEVKTQINAKYK